MSSSETGYAKNAANLKDLIIRLKTLGNEYQPPRSTFSIKALEQLSAHADEATRKLSKALPVYSKAVDEQEFIFKQLNKLITKSYNYLKAAAINQAELQTAKTLADGLRGIIKRKAVKANPSATSQLRLSYDSKVENFKQYIDILISTQYYAPKETAISIKSFQTLLAGMENSITAVAITKTPVDDARKNRFSIFYDTQAGLVSTVLGIKNYIRASLDHGHPQRKHILVLTFTRVKE